MASRSLIITSLVILVGSFFASYDGIRGIARAPKVFGVFRHQNKTQLAEENDLITIPNTTFCEDLHYHEGSGLLFTACEASESARYSWFPPLGNFDDPSVAYSTQGRLQVIDPSSMKSKFLDLNGFKGPFVTHGIDVIDDPDRSAGEAVYIFAVNHVPNKRYFEQGDAQAPKSRSVIEVFHHEIGSASAVHVRTVWHELITTPNDVLALSPTSFLTTNDHFYAEGHLRSIEDIYFGAKWSNTVHVSFSKAETASKDDTNGVEASIALRNIHNNNGIGRGKLPGDVVVATAASGTLRFGKLATVDDDRVIIDIKSIFEADSTLDNPSYFADPFANDTFDASGHVQCGLTRGADLLENIRDPAGKDGVMVWHISPVVEDINRSSTGGRPQWQGRLLFEDDASRIRSGSAAVLVAIDPAQENGHRKAWLFVTGFMSKNMIAVKIDL